MSGAIWRTIANLGIPGVSVVAEELLHQAVQNDCKYYEEDLAPEGIKATLITGNGKEIALRYGNNKNKEAKA